MAHPSLGLPPPDASAGLPGAAARLRTNRHRLGSLALETTLRLADFEERYDEASLRLFLRDYERHVEQLARAVETGDASFVANYAEWLVPIYRRRRIPMRDCMALIYGLREAVATVLTPTESEAAAPYFELWADRFKRHARLAGDHRGNPLVRFFWKGAGIGDDKWV